MNRRHDGRTNPQYKPAAGKYQSVISLFLRVAVKRIFRHDRPVFVKHHKLGGTDGDHWRPEIQDA